MAMFALVTLLVIVGSALGDISSSNPSRGACLCADGTRINVRSAACGRSVIGSINRGQCFTYLDSKQPCSLNGGRYTFFKIRYGQGDGWVAGSFLNTASGSQCQPNRTPSSSGSSAGPVQIVTRSQWRARSPSSSQSSLRHPVGRVFIHHTETGSCTTRSACVSIVKSIQNYHMTNRSWSDIGYNFLVGEDGSVYEGRGWDRVGAHVEGYNGASIGISVIGNYMRKLPNEAALRAVRQLIQHGVSAGKLSRSYTLHGHRDGGRTDCPGDALYDLIGTWPNYGGRLR